MKTIIYIFMMIIGAVLAIVGLAVTSTSETVGVVAPSMAAGGTAMYLVGVVLVIRES